MTWTTARPTKVGWYWFRDVSRPYEDEREPYVVKVRQRGGRLCVGNCDIDGPPYNGEWLGPITPDSYQQERVASCDWKYDCVDDYYDTECGNAYCLTDGTLTDNDHRYCPFCGGLIDEQIVVDEEVDE